MKIIERLQQSQKYFPKRSFSDDLSYLNKEIRIEPSIIPEYISTRDKCSVEHIPAILDETVGITWRLNDKNCPKTPEFRNIIKKIFLLDSDAKYKLYRIRDLKEFLPTIVDIEKKVSATSDKEIRERLANKLGDMSLEYCDTGSRLRKMNEILDPLNQNNKPYELFQSLKNPILKNAMLPFHKKLYTSSGNMYKYYMERVADMDMSLSFISDTNMKKQIEKIISDGLVQEDSYVNYDAFSRVESLIDICNNLEGNYSTIWSADYVEYIRYLKNYDTDLYKVVIGELDEDLIDNLEVVDPKQNGALKSFFRKIFGKENSSEKLSEIETRFNKSVAEFQESMRVDSFVKYCKENNDEFSERLYKDVYLKREDFTPEIRERLANISDKYGVKIFPNKVLDYDLNDSLIYIEYELYSWSKASNGSVKYPPVIDCTTSKRDYVDDKRAYGKGVAAGYSEAYTTGAISIHRSDFDRIRWAFRHEFMHTNDLKRLTSFEDGFVVKDGDEIDAKKCKFYDDFVKLGINEYHIPYAYNKPMEFIAVAAESDNLSECSPEFRQALIGFGMPEWMFDVKNPKEYMSALKRAKK